MKTKLRSLRLLIMLLLTAISSGAMAQITTNPDKACLNSSENYFVDPTVGSTYNWVLSGGGTIASGQGSNSIMVNWTSTGSFTLTVTETTAALCTGLPVTLNIDVESVVPVIAGPVAACVGSTTSTYTTDAGMTDYVWNISAGGTITGGAATNVITVTWNTAGSQNVSVNYKNANLCTAALATVYNVTVNPLTVPTITGPATACVNSTTSIYTTEAGMTNYVWTLSAGGAITGGTGTNAITVTWNTAGAQTVSVNYDNATSCSAAVATLLNVDVKSLPVVTLTGSNAVCVGSTAEVYTTEPGKTAYTWLVSAGGLVTLGGGANDNTVTVTWTTAGPQSVSVNYSSADGCRATIPTVRAVTVNPLPVTSLIKHY